MLCPGVGGDVVVEDHQQEQGHAQEVREQRQLAAGNHDSVWKEEEIYKNISFDNNKLRRH